MSNQLNKIILDALEDLKGKDIVSLDVTGLSDVMDTLVIASGTSNRHVRSGSQEKGRHAYRGRRP